MNTILQHLPTGYQEIIQYGMLSYIVPEPVFSDTYNHRLLPAIGAVHSAI